MHKQEAQIEAGKAGVVIAKPIWQVISTDIKLSA
jgi:hypothetical protein